MSTPISYPYYRNVVSYGSEHRLQTLDICLPRPLADSSPKDTVWIVFIHGGAWRDPTQDSTELQPALAQLFSRESSKTALEHIAGFASINYGLSGHLKSSGEDRSLTVRHPTHIQDVLKALQWLRTEYRVGLKQDREGEESGYNWVVMGHSCGATLAFQICMSYSRPFGELGVGSLNSKPPVAVVGLEGIYDLPLLIENHSDQPMYQGFVEGAFGNDRRVWKEVSPVCGQYKPAFWAGGLRTVVLGHSNDDELVEWEQAGMMWRCLEGQGWNIENTDEAGDPTADIGDDGLRDKELVILQLSGTHEKVWSEGTGVRTAIEIVLEKVSRRS